MSKKQLTAKSKNLSKWYTQVIQQANLADYAPVKGCMVFKPAGYGIWENIQKNFDPLLKKLEVENTYFPLFIPMSLLNKETTHVQGFSPELAVVTHGGGEELAEKLAVRPTSETIMYSMYSQWIQSHRDLPIRYNQWNNVVRWEKRTYFFLRTTEFLWQEAHTAHSTHQEAWQMALDALAAYQELVEEYLAIPVFKGKKSQTETFAGADLTTTIEAVMPDGKALQSGTSHDLGQNFAKAFEIKFQNKNGQTDYAWQTSFGLSTRIIGALIMTHGDDNGLCLPPKIAPYQVMIINANQDDQLIKHCQTIQQSLIKVGIRVKNNFSPHYSLGWKLNEAELQGYPLIMIVGKKELTLKQVTISIRHKLEKKQIPLAKIDITIPQLLAEIQTEMLQKARNMKEKLTSKAENYDQFKKIMKEQRGFIKAFWCEKTSCEAKIKEETKATTRCLPFINNHGQVKEEKGHCIYCGQPAQHQWYFAQAY